MNANKSNSEIELFIGSLTTEKARIIRRLNEALPPGPLVRRKDAAKAVHESPLTWRNRDANGRGITKVHLGRLVYYQRIDLLRWLASQLYVESSNE